MKTLPPTCPCCGGRPVFRLPSFAGFTCGLQYVKAFGFDWQRLPSTECRHAFRVALAQKARIEALQAELRSLRQRLATPDA